MNSCVLLNLAWTTSFSCHPGIGNEKLRESIGGQSLPPGLLTDGDSPEVNHEGPGEKGNNVHGEEIYLQCGNEADCVCVCVCKES